MGKALWTLGYATGALGYMLTELVMAIVEDVKKPEQQRTSRPHD